VDRPLTRATNFNFTPPEIDYNGANMKWQWTTLISLSLMACGGTAAGAHTSPLQIEGPPTGEQAMSDDEWGDWDDEAGGAAASHAAQPQGHRSAIEILGGIQPPPTPWAQMGYDEREFLMVGVVLPITDELITEFDAPRGETFGCQNCHGNNMRERHFAMPSTQRMPIPPAGTPAYETVRSSFPDIVSFMEERFTEDVGILLGSDDFSCNSCHPIAG